MKPSNLFQLEWKEAAADRRSLLLRIGLAFLLGFPFVAAAMPVRVRAAGLVTLVLFTSLFGAAVARVRRRFDGRWDALRLLPVHPLALHLDVILAGALVDLLQTAPLFGITLAVHGRNVTPAMLVDLFGLLVGVIVLLNALGVLVGSVFRSNAEVHLGGALLVALTAFGSGLIPTPERLRPLTAAVQGMNPVSALAEALAAAAQGTPVATGFEAGGWLLAASGLMMTVRFMRR